MKHVAAEDDGLMFVVLLSSFFVFMPEIVACEELKLIDVVSAAFDAAADLLSPADELVVSHIEMLRSLLLLVSFVDWF
jgi:hypothetical protein